MLISNLSGLLKALMLTAFVALTGSDVAAQDQQTATYGDWVVRCTQRQDVPPCDMHQTVANQQGRVALEVTLGYRPDENVYILRAELPLGFMLPPGVLIKVDDELEFREVVVTRCVQRGCLVEGRPSEDMINAFRQGSQAQFLVVTPDARGLALLFSLRGFAPALEELVARNSAD